MNCKSSYQVRDIWFDESFFFHKTFECHFENCIDFAGHQPRYIVYSYKMVHDDNRISYPMCFIFYTPRDSQMELQIMYAGSKRALQREADLTRVYEIRELDELTEDWLREKLAR